MLATANSNNAEEQLTSSHSPEPSAPSKDVVSYTGRLSATHILIACNVLVFYAIPGLLPILIWGCCAYGEAIMVRLH